MRSLKNMLEIVSCHWQECLAWLTKTPYKVTIVDKEGSGKQNHINPTYVIPNRGDEASAYLKYIIERYDTLPDSVAFVHGHQTSPHQHHDRPLLDMIHAAKVSEFGYIPLNNIENMHTYTNDSFIEMLINSPVKPAIGETVRISTAAQFILSKNTILKNTLQHYKFWYTLAISDIPCIGLRFEYLWDFIFKVGELRPSQDYFTVSTCPVINYHDWCKKDDWMHQECLKYYTPGTCCLKIEYNIPEFTIPPCIIIYDETPSQIEVFMSSLPVIEMYRPPLIVRRDMPVIRSYLEDIGYILEDRPWGMCLALSTRVADAPSSQ